MSAPNAVNWYCGKKKSAPDDESGAHFCCAGHNSWRMGRRVILFSRASFRVSFALPLLFAYIPAFIRAYLYRNSVLMKRLSAHSANGFVFPAPLIPHRIVFGFVFGVPFQGLLPVFFCNSGRRAIGTVSLITACHYIICATHNAFVRIPQMPGRSSVVPNGVHFPPSFQPTHLTIPCPGAT